MPTSSRSLCLCLGVAACALSPGTARASSVPPVPVSMPTLAFYQVNFPVPIPGVTTYEAVLSGYIFQPGSLAQSQFDDFSIASFQEKQFEANGGTVVFGFGTTPLTYDSSGKVTGGDTDWILSGDLRFAAPRVNAIPEDPLPPSDPLTFLIGVQNPPNGFTLNSAPFTATTVTGRTIPLLVITNAVPEPSTLALLGLGVSGVLAVSARRRRA